MKGSLMPGFIAVHVGAGLHADQLKPSYQKTCKNACRAALHLLRDGCSSVEAIAAAVSVLEDCPLTNAGIGSNLSLKGTIECDAGIMDGCSLRFGSVGSLCNIKNPVQVARKILEEQSNPLSCGRVSPCTLVGKGALEWALDHGFEFFEESQMLTKTSERSYLRNLNLLKRCAQEQVLPNQPCDENALLDTVGAVCVDSSGNVSSAVSSGGLLLKISGRIGQSTVYGSGCWAQNSSDPDKPGIACSATGVGEYLIKTMFARECYRTMYDKHSCMSALPDVFKRGFVESPFLENVSSKLAGILTVKHYVDDALCELAWAHNTKTMVLGYGSTSNRKPVALVSEQPAGSVVGKTIVGGEKCIRLT